MHDACLPSFHHHHGTCPRHLNCQVFTSGRFIFLYFFDFLTLDLAGMILAFVNYFWLFVQIFWMFWMFLDFVEFSHFWLFYWLVQPDVGWRGFMQQMGLDMVDGRRCCDGNAGK